ncbi:anthranilate synthase component I family protein [Agrococcus sp. SGAir0287]|uniref:anthranilate synthase component I family protein n=1 Tax=Agrococcus sp. SGAir0287 TaxID=2070347 RepID=UPI0020C7B0BD|nr:anthranilate synthase component I family protein [Agrococcus sp. SGAir0287]
MAPAHGLLMPWLGAASWQDIPVEDAAGIATALWGMRAHGCPRDVVWLDSASGGRHVLGVGDATLVVRDGVATRDGAPIAGDALDALEAASAEGGAWVGWLGYEAGVRLLGLEPRASRHPDAAWLRLSTWIVLDDETGRAQLQSRHAQPEPLPAATRPPWYVDAPPAAVRRRDDAASYLAAIAACQRAIRDGDSYLLCLTTALETGPIDALATYLRLRATARAHHGGLLRIAGTTLASASPERFLRLEDGRVQTSPIKGTRRRGTGADDAALAEELRTSEKERAENVMIVDLCRNDLQRVCEPGSVAVTSLLAVETYPTVHQLVSTIAGTVRDGVGPVDVLRATFPAGSMTGAPKRRTVELLQSLETGPRGVYSGCFGAVTADACDLAMVIRSIVADDAGATIGVGGGITALSVPEEELDEVALKAEALVRALVPAGAGDGARGQAARDSA